jgi:alcohol dehydrogenase class IV
VAEILGARQDGVAHFKVARLAVAAAEVLLDAAGAARRLRDCGVERSQLAEVMEASLRLTGADVAGPPLDAIAIADILEAAF